ncbi:hypothetical protein [Rathayibacter iranicus]|nr:hypothetical protein [Rathayibacter iranicus]MWV31904.1 hypothetical protein [Rathayibacter iranicus NCPPB 2253 = VKM Ac-1602]
MRFVIREDIVILEDLGHHCVPMCENYPPFRVMAIRKYDYFLFFFGSPVR